MLKNMRIGKRLGFAFGLMVLMISALSAFALMQLNQITKTQAHLESLHTQTLEPMFLIREALAQTGLAARNAYIHNDQQKARRELDNLDKHRATYLEALGQIRPFMTGNPAFDKVNTGLLAMADALKRPRTYREAKRLTEYGKFLVNECMPLRNQIVADMEVFLKEMHEEVNRAEEEVNTVASMARMAIISATTLIALIATALAVMVLRSIVIPLTQATAFARQVATGDLTSKIRLDSRDEMGDLVRSLQEMNDNLSKIVADVRTGSESIASASSEIASGNLDLSSRTEQQASSLEETASAMEELTSTVKQNADNAHQANGLAVSASEVATRGGTVVSEVVQTMGAINDSARKIVDIIGVIDGIAFQTNILALNAAVEAARAGEQGRGFAVVAAEVRNLAQRSANAAKEIKSLISDSVEKVDTGSKLVDQAGDTMQEIVESIKRVADIVSEISAASDEQRVGIEQVSQAITQMDEVTQQNAALVEEAAAAAGSMQDQANTLTQVVSAFKLDSSVAHGMPQARKPQARKPQPAKASKPAIATPLRTAPKPAARPSTALAANTAAPLPAPVSKRALVKAGSNEEWDEF